VLTPSTVKRKGHRCNLAAICTISKTASGMINEALISELYNVPTPAAHGAATPDPAVVAMPGRGAERIGKSRTRFAASPRRDFASAVPASCSRNASTSLLWIVSKISRDCPRAFTRLKISCRMLSLGFPRSARRWAAHELMRT
jgi:hypothetical protein